MFQEPNMEVKIEIKYVREGGRCHYIYFVYYTNNLLMQTHMQEI